MLSKITFVFLLNLKYVSQTDNTLSRIPKQAKKQQQTTGRSGIMWKQLILILMEHLNIGHKMSVKTIKIQQKYKPDFRKHKLWVFVNEVIAWSS